MPRLSQSIASNHRLSAKAGSTFRSSFAGTTGVDDAHTDHSGNWQANLQKAKDGHCHVMGVAVRSGDSWIKAINADFEIK
jgi:hypothetical protein